MWTRLTTFLNRHEYLLLLLLLTILLRLPSLIEPVWSGDEVIYLAIGQGLNHGGQLYQSISDYPVKPPGMYLLAAWLPSVALLRFAILLLGLVGVWAFWRLAGWFFDNFTARWFVSLSYVLLLSTPLLEGTLTNAETIFVPLGLLSMALVFPNLSSKRAWFFSGGLLALAVWFKVPAASDILVLVGAAFLISPRLKVAGMLSKLGSMLVGGLTGLVVLILISSPYVSWQGYMDASREVLGYLQAWHGADSEASLPLGLGQTQTRLGIIGLVTLIMVYLSRSNAKLQLVVWWLGLTLAAALTSGRPYAHYLLHPAPAALVLATFWWLSIGKSGAMRVVTSATMSLIVLVWWLFGFTVWPVRGYYQAAIAKILGGDQSSYLASFDQSAPTWHQAGVALRGLVPVGAEIFVWGEAPHLYVLSQRPPAGEFVTSYHYRELPSRAQDLETLLARYVVVDVREPLIAPMERLLSKYQYASPLSQQYHLYRRWQ